MTWQLPWVARGRLDDARATIAKLEAQVAGLEIEQRRLINLILRRHHVEPIFPETGATSTAAMQSIAPVPPPVAVDPLAAEVRTPVSEALSTGARSARDICSSVEKTLAHRQRVQKGEARPRPAVAPRVPSALQDVANELEAILASPGAVLQPGGNGKH